MFSESLKRFTTYLVIAYFLLPILPFRVLTSSLPTIQVFLDYAGDFSLVTDLLRGKIFVPSLVAMAAVISALATHPDILIIKIKNRVGESRRLVVDINCVFF